MSDILYGQVWAYTLGIGDLLDQEKIKLHLKKEAKRNDSPFGLKACDIDVIFFPETLPET